MKEETYKQVNKAFEKSVRLLQENLQYLADHDKVGEKLLSLQNQVLSSLIGYQHFVEGYLNQLNWEIYALSGKVLTAEQHSENLQESFEAICVIHGITDFALWMVNGKNYLVAEAIAHHRDSEIQLPKKLMDFIDQMNTSDQSELRRILQTKKDPRFAKEMRELRERMSKKQYA